MTPKASELASEHPEGDRSAAGAEPASPPPAVAANSEQPGTILSIQILRFIAALLVVVFHAHVALAGQFLGHKEDAIDHAFRVGASGVHIFFVISGFVMVYTTWRSNLTSGKFLSRRLIRIYPIYWIMGAIYLVAHILLGTAYHLSAGQIFEAALLLPVASSYVIGPGWTLSFEMYFYICFAIALVAGLRKGLLILTAFYFLSTLAGLFIGTRPSFGYVLTDSLLLEFIAGAWLGYAFAHGLVFGRRLAGFFIVAGILLFASGFWLPVERLPSVISWGIPSFLLVSGVLAFEPSLRTVWGRRVAKMGDSSYLLYLSHVLVIDLLIATPIRYWDSSLSAAVMLSLPIAVICTIAAAIGYEVLELPLLKLLKRWVLPGRKQRSRSLPSTA